MILRCDQVRFAYPSSGKNYCFTWSLEEGRIAVLVGKSGSGKSTFLSLIAGLLTPLSGEIWVARQNVKNKRAYERELSILFQSYNVFPHLTAYQNVAIGLSPSMQLTQEQRQEVLDLFRELDIASCIQSPASTLSGGESQRIAIIRCLMRRKPLWLLDEPFSSFDKPLRMKGYELIYTKAKQHKISIVMASHHPEEIKPFADSWALLESGMLYPQ